MIMKIADEIRDQLDQADYKIELLFNDVKEDEFLVNQDFLFLTELWNKLQVAIEERTGHIKNFEVSLDKIEQVNKKYLYLKITKPLLKFF